MAKNLGENKEKEKKQGVTLGIPRLEFDNVGIPTLEFENPGVQL